ncbi:hypothetical protein [Xanthomonas floridensis]|uniref:Uncharacterized protein n=1 Tax=Xanthomonas floridensis TaxID=1843580 RepID=A0ABU5Q0J8_9XANT|nr:hypothetical protein [Xanthomonas floridensis]MEA5125380.1 hypothetical protein [Xanthomonas floridensis]MEA5133214.1 hypothetical protein [Xanthomonas floridensis]
MTNVLFATARATKAGFIFLGSVLFSCVAATVLSGFFFALLLAISSDSGTAGAFFSYYCFFSFCIGSPIFFFLGVPILHFVPGLKYAHPYIAGIAGAAIAGSIVFILRLMHNSVAPPSSFSSVALFIACPSLWAAIASCIYQRSKELASAT